MKTSTAVLKLKRPPNVTYAFLRVYIELFVNFFFSIRPLFNNNMQFAEH